MTWTKESPHLYGCAWDFVPIRLGKLVWDNKRPENHEYKQAFARLFRNPVHAAEIARQEKLKA